MANILIVDDEESDLQLMRSILTEAGHKIYLATTGEKAMKLFLRQPIDVVVTDIEMPRGDGIELISGVTGMDPDAQILAVSGKGGSKLQSAQLAGARITLEKPLTRETLVAAVDKLCAGLDSGGETQA